MIDQSKLEIMEQQRNSSNEIIDKISILKEASKSWFQQLNANDQKLVSNQIDLLCQQKSSNDMLRALIETTWLSDLSNSSLTNYDLQVKKNE